MCSIGLTQIWHCKDITCLPHQRLCILCGDFWGAERDGECYFPDGLDSFTTEGTKGLHRFLELLLVIAHFFEGRMIHPAQVGLAEAQQIQAAQKPNISSAHPTQRETQSTQKTSPMGEGLRSLLKWLPPLKLSKVGLF
jgi:hypothetical protein